jgi:hypothetical protein
MVKQIIKEAIEKNPIGLKEAVEAELMSRVQLALEAKKTSMEDDHDDEDELNEEALTTLATIYLVSKLAPVGVGAALIAVGGAAYAASKIIGGGIALKKALDDAKQKADSNAVRRATERLEKAKKASADPKKGGMLKRLADKALSVIKRKAKNSEVSEDLIYESFEDVMYIIMEDKDGYEYEEEEELDESVELSEGTTNFLTKIKAKNAKEAFDTARKNALKAYGNRGYSGSVAEKDDFVEVKAPAAVKKDEALLDKFLDGLLDDPRFDGTRNPAAVVQISRGTYAIVGWASE